MGKLPFHFWFSMGKASEHQISVEFLHFENAGVWGGACTSTFFK